MDEQAGIWRFGAVELDEQLAILRLHGARVPLDRSSYDILLALLRHSGEVVTKDELLETGWPGRIVSENSLAKAVSRLRRALGEDASALRVVHGYGYRLAAAVAREALPPTATAAVAQGAQHLHPGDSVPHRPGWQLLRCVGRGASGVVWLARDGAGAQRALKFATSEVAVRTLKREVALSRYLRAAREEFRGVAPVLGWNLAEAPFFLELPWFEEGNLSEWAAARGGLAAIPREQRLGLCIRLCDAVADLHELGIVHRDLKPGNLYPVEDPRAPGGWTVVVGDLGAGVAIGASRLADLDLSLTLADAEGRDASRYPGSLLYMAPEVVAGELPTQRSDVFALGVILFQLAVGDLLRTLAPGWDADVGDPLLVEDIRLAAAANPERRGIDARELAQRLRTLEARHAQADVQRRQAAELARQAGELRRMARRRRWLVGGTVALGAVLSLSLWQQHRIGTAHAQAREAAAAAEAESETTRAVLAFLTEDVLRQGDPYASGVQAPTLREALDRAAAVVDRRFADRPRVAAAIHGTLAGAYVGHNDFERAVHHHERQVAALRSATPVDPGALADALADLCEAQHWQGDLARVWAACNDAREAHVAAGRAPDRPDVFLSLADSREGRYRDAMARLAPLLPRIRAGDDRDTHANAVWFAAIYTGRLGRLEEHARLTAELMEVRRPEGDSMDHAWALATHGNALLLLGEEEAGLAHLARAEAMFRKVGGADHPHAEVPRVRMAEHRLRLGDWEATRAIARPTLDALLAGTGWQNWTVYVALAAMEAEARLGRRAEALGVVAAFQAMADEGLDRLFPYLRDAHWQGMARTWVALGDAERATPYVERLRALSADPDAHPVLAGEVACLDAELALLRDDATAARAHALACHGAIARVVPADSPLLARPARLLRAAR